MHQYEWGGGSSRLGQIPNFYRKFVLQAPLNSFINIAKLLRVREEEIDPHNIFCSPSTFSFLIGFGKVQGSFVWEGELSTCLD